MKRIQLTQRILNPLPIRLEIDDYHQFDDIRDNFCKLVTGIKVKEIGFNGNYIGIAYSGKLTDKKNADMIQKIKTESKEFDNNN